MSNQQRLVREFMEIEVDNRLFDLVDINGVHVWDIVRFDIEYSLLWNYTPATDGVKNNWERRWQRVKRVFGAISLLIGCTKRRTLVITTSRNKLDGHNVDYNQHQALAEIDPKEMLILETIQGVKAYNGSYPIGAKNLFTKLRKQPSLCYDFEPIIKIIEAKFGKISQTNESLNDLLQNFYDERVFYLWLFRKRKIERVLLSQNGQMKGLLAAATQAGVKVYEFQHGIVNEKHFVYSYPPLVEDIEAKSYQPYKMLRFSNFWFSDFYAPFEKATIGNNFFSTPVPSTPTETQSLLVISTNAFGVQLSDLLSQVAHSNQNWKIYYKLHPNEFENLDYYKIKFENRSSIEIIRDEHSVNELLSRCSTMLTMQSTAIYEALQAGRNVIIVDSGEYNEIENQGVYHITTFDQLVDLLDKPLCKADQVVFFEPFNNKSFLDAIEE